MAAIGSIPADALACFTVLGDLALDGTLTPVAGVLPAAVAANARGHGLICPETCGPEAAWASSEIDVIAPRSLIQLANHFKGMQVLARPEPAVRAIGPAMPDLRDIKGQESANRALEIAAAGGHKGQLKCQQCQYIGRDLRDRGRDIIPSQEFPRSLGCIRWLTMPTNQLTSSQILGQESQWISFCSDAGLCLR